MYAHWREKIHFKASGNAYYGDLIDFPGQPLAIRLLDAPEPSSISFENWPKA